MKFHQSFQKFLGRQCNGWTHIHLEIISLSFKTKKSAMALSEFHEPKIKNGESSHHTHHLQTLDLHVRKIDKI